QHTGSSASTRPLPSSSRQLSQTSGVVPGVATVALLSPGFGSVSLAVTVAVLLKAFSPVRVAVMVTEAAPFGARSPRVHVTSCAAIVHAPWLAVAVSGLTAPGSGSVTVTLVAGAGPLLVTTSA